MTDKEQQNKLPNRISDSERFRYIGFEVFPGKPKDLFKSETEKKNYIDSIIKKRNKGELIRDHCTLTEARISFMEKLVLAVACGLILVALFVPWYSAYTEVEDEAPAATEISPGDIPADNLVAVNDSLGLMAAGTESPVTPTTADSTVTQQRASHEEIIHGMQAKKRTHKDFYRLSGLGAILALGSVGSHIFSGGFILMLTGIFLLAYTLLCIVLPLYNLYSIFGLKGKDDEKAIKLKKFLKFNWIPVILFVLVLVLSFFGASYDPETVGAFTSIGDSYGPAVLLDSLSWGLFLTISGFLMLALKGVEI
ncbi:MAG: hypothetical protein PHU88_08625 [candidate division Zixibacteria bacterium]|nr:hypothetical protein [candidate division Zixibacteria bacterium]MDD5426229.1 hypothetical protein [candidate division Zixibacteria bacterium]